MKNKLTMQSMDVVDSNINAIKDLFPQVVVETTDKDGKIKQSINFEKLKQELQDNIVDNKSREIYDFTWPGKRAASIEANTQTTNTLRPCREDSVDFDTTENLYIEGDNLEVLKILLNSYQNKVKMIYIDPPYNTGNDFIYNDHFAMTNEEYNEKSNSLDEDGNVKFTQNKATNPRYHSDWCNMMYPRLKLARKLLTDDGVIFISIDDNEQANLKKICDEIFGSGNFYGELIQLKGNTQNDSKSIQKNHEYILVYCNTMQPLLLTYNNSVRHEVYEDEFYLGRDTGSSSGHDKLSERPNLGYTIYYYESTQNGQTGNHNKLSERPNLAIEKYSDFKCFESENKVVHAVALMDYDYNKITGNATEKDVYNDNEFLISQGYKIIRPPKRKGDKLGCWTWSIDNFKNLWNTNQVLIKNDKNIIKKEYIDKSQIIEINGKKYYEKLNILPVQSIVKISNSDGTSILSGNNGLIPGIDFANPKNPELIKFFLSSYNDENIIILDFFSGSATTAHAVMQLNAEDGGKRKFILVNLPEECKKDSEAYKQGFKNICEIGKERIRRAGKKIKEEFLSKKDITEEEKQRIENLDIGFRVLKLDSSNMNDVFYTPNEISQDLLDSTLNNIKDDRTPEDLLFSYILEFGLQADIHYEIKKINGFDVYVVGDGELIACFDKDVSEDTIMEIAKMSPLRVVFRDSTFKTPADRINANEIFKTFSMYKDENIFVL